MTRCELSRRHSVALRGAATSWVLCCTCACMCEEAPSIAAIQEAWVQRQVRVPAARLEWTVTEYITSGSIMVMRDGKRREAGPMHDTTMTRSVSLLLSGAKMKYSYLGEVLERDVGRVFQKRYMSVFDGQTSQSFHEDIERSAKEYPLGGFIRRGQDNYDFRNREIAPILVTFRGCELSCGGVDLESYECGLKRANVNGHMCSALQPRTWTEKEYKRTYWVDSTRDYIVLRIVYGRMGKPPIYSTDIDYHLDAASVWVPSRWHTIVTSGSATRVDSQLSVDNVVYTADNDIPDAAFTIEFPPGTAVVDRRSATDFAPGERFIVRQDGSKRMVTNEELSRGARYADLVSTESGEAAKANDIKGHRRVMIIAVSVVCLGLVVCAFWRTRRIVFSLPVSAQHDRKNS